MIDDAYRDRRREYQPDWQCTACGAVFEAYPDRCPECGHDSFRLIER